MEHQFSRPRCTAVALDPHPLCHSALSTLLGRIDIDLVGAATSASTAKMLLQEHRPSLLVLDVDLPEGRDEALRLIAAGRIETPDLTVIVLSGTDDRGIIEGAIDRGAAAYILKSTDTDAIATAIRQVFEPSVYLAGPKERAHAEATQTPEVLGKLTRRELEILQLVSGGRSNRQVAQILWITDQTVKFHLANIYRKLGVRSRFEAARWARENGILDVVVDTGEAISASEPAGNGNGHAAPNLVSFRSPRPRPSVTERLEETSQ